MEAAGIVAVASPRGGAAAARDEDMGSVPWMYGLATREMLRLRS
jgi:hypothetical protein